MVDDMSGFGGLSADLLPDLKDAAGLNTALVFSLTGPLKGPEPLADQV